MPKFCNEFASTLSGAPRFFDYVSCRSECAARVEGAVISLQDLGITPLAWGAFTFDEPRVASAVWILALTGLVYLVARWIDEPGWLPFAAVANAAIVILVLHGAINILHPVDPIVGSDSIAIKVFYAAIVLVTGAIALQFARDRAENLAKARKPSQG